MSFLTYTIPDGSTQLSVFYHDFMAYERIFGPSIMAEYDPVM